jgi:hypothetical protein
VALAVAAIVATPLMVVAALNPTPLEDEYGWNCAEHGNRNCGIALMSYEDEYDGETDNYTAIECEYDGPDADTDDCDKG